MSLPALELAACRHINRVQQRDNACWADVPEPLTAARIRPCWATAVPIPDLGLCATHLQEIWGIKLEADS